MDTQKPIILIVDDNRTNFVLLTEILEQFDCEFDYAASGKETLMKIENTEYALTLLDVQMPEMDGYQTLEKMTQIMNNRLMPVIFISAIYSDDYYKIKGIKTGAVDFMAKPLVSEILIGKVNVFLNLYHNKKELERINVELKQVIEEKQKVEEKVRKSLSEKERLLSEIHHRVKNNMQMVATMLSLQSKYGNPENMIEAFEKSIDRINSMAMVHEKLYESKNFGEVEMKLYIEELAYELVGAYQGDKNIELKLSLDCVMLEIDTAITLGLLLNELITNTVKYAFPNKMTGTVTIEFTKADEDYLRLAIIDDGVGLPADFELRKNKSLGMQLIDGFVRELYGKLNISSNNGTNIEVLFKPVKKSRT